MRCYICNSIIDHPVWDADTGSFAPCPACSSEIDEVAMAWALEDSEVRTTLKKVLDKVW